jgi:transcriptional regulator with XRE-family HTH domain
VLQYSQRFGFAKLKFKEGGVHMMKFDYSKLLGKMREYGYTQEKLAKAIGINESTLNTKLNNKTYFTTKEIDKICELLDISNAEIGIYFYSK